MKMARSEYVVERYPTGTVEQTLSRTKMLVRITRFVAPSVWFRFREREEGEPKSEPTPWMKRLAALRYVRDHTFASDIGYRLFIERRKDKERLRIWKVEAEEVEPVPDLGCAPQLEKAHAYLFGKWGGRIRSGGRFVCRFVSGTATVTRHGYRQEKPEWKGAAEDIFVVVPNTMSFLEEVAEDLVNEAREGKLLLRKVIVAARMWTPSGGWEPYSGVFHRHIHYEVEGGEPCTP